MKNNNLIWIDLEMTGLNPSVHRIIEIATLVTDSNLNVISLGPVIAVHQNQQNISLMDKWNVRVHEKNGLIKRVKTSLYDERKAEAETIVFLKKWVPIKSSPMCGNSITQDRRFLFQYMPDLENYFHYRCIDVSTLKELVSRWNPVIFKRMKKKHTHTALQDIQESIKELNFYKKNFLLTDLCLK
ncbi:oligoribonuclease [Buchnera aphidicola (Muscaphis stroyani)]|uniref:Oligoribonuclease n=1 Tax=Buchnera aphidicola (Muscaphis stroyani) TaxID=1241869 RepID=A0A4D6YFF3_9GAMM|nr:oligoribonuclease [Buchnera aphidicola]QCI24604.1 oligoribonuclease [Buchnera aphidicola (Muscaphis stroyani)]